MGSSVFRSENDYGQVATPRYFEGHGRVWILRLQSFESQQCPAEALLAGVANSICLVFGIPWFLRHGGFVGFVCFLSCLSGVFFLLGGAGLGVPRASQCQDHSQYPGNSQTVFAEATFGAASAPLSRKSLKSVEHLLVQ